MENQIRCNTRIDKVCSLMMFRINHFVMKELKLNLFPNIVLLIVTLRLPNGSAYFKGNLNEVDFHSISS